MRVPVSRAFQDYLDELAASTDSAGLFAAINKIAQFYDLTSFAYILAPSEKASGIKLISSYPTSWTSHYLANGYELRDPVIAMARAVPDPFDWGLETETGSRWIGDQLFMREAADFGIRCGFTFPIRDRRSQYAALSFASDHWSPNFRSCFERQRQVFHLLAMLFHAKARITLTPMSAVGGVHLSPREVECLMWATQGKSAWEIGKILNLSRRTAAFHLDNAKSKLGVRTIQQAVALFCSSQKR